MSASVSGWGTACPVAPERGAGALHELVDVAHQLLDVELAGDVAGLDAGHVLVALVLGLGEPAARVEPERAERRRAPARLRDRRVGLRDLGGAAARSRRPGT